MTIDGHLEEAEINLGLQEPQEPALQFLVADLGGKWIETGSYDGVFGIMHAPHQIGKGFALEGCRTGKGGDVLADLLSVGVVYLELDPFGFLGQGTEFVHQADQIIKRPLRAHGSGSSVPSSRSSKPSSSASLISSDSSIGGSS